jgi:Na+/H+ antiporter NhaA
MNFTPAITRAFSEFSESEKSSAVTLIGCTVLCLLIANSFWGNAYQQAGTLGQ